MISLKTLKKYKLTRGVKTPFKKKAMETVTKLSRKELKRVYKDLTLRKVKIQVWWDAIEGQDKDLTMSVVKEVEEINKRYESIKEYILTRPEVGKGCTYGAGSDCYPATIVEVSPNGKTIWVTNDTSKPTKNYNYYGNQEHTFETNWDAPRTCYTLRKNGRWIQKGAGLNEYWCGIGIGGRRYYQDPHF